MDYLQCLYRLDLNAVISIFRYENHLPLILPVVHVRALVFV